MSVIQFFYELSWRPFFPLLYLFYLLIIAFSICVQVNSQRISLFQEI